MKLIKNLPTNKSPGWDDLTGEFYKIWREGIIIILHKLFYKIEENGTCPSLFY